MRINQRETRDREKEKKDRHIYKGERGYYRRSNSLIRTTTDRLKPFFTRITKSTYTTKAHIVPQGWMYIYFFFFTSWLVFIFSTFGGRIYHTSGLADFVFTENFFFKHHQVFIIRKYFGCVPCRRVSRPDASMSLFFLFFFAGWSNVYTIWWYIIQAANCPATSPCTYTKKKTTGGHGSTLAFNSLCVVE